MKHILFKAGIFALLAMTQITKSDVKVINMTNFPIRAVMFIQSSTHSYVRSDEIPSEMCQWLQGDIWANKWRYIIQVKEKRNWLTIWDTINETGGENWSSGGNRELVVIQHGNETPSYSVTDNPIGLSGGTQKIKKNGKDEPLKCIDPANRLRYGSTHFMSPEQAWSDQFGNW